VVYGLAAVLPRMGRYAFGYRQFAVVGVVGLLIGGLGLQAVLAARGSWDVGTDRLPPAWPIVSSSPASAHARVLWLGRLSGDPFPPPGGDPMGSISVAGISLRYGLTGQDGVTALDIGRDQRGPGYAYLRRGIAEILSGDTSHGGALLAPLGIRFVVAASGDLPRAARRKLAGQLDLDLHPTHGLTIYRNARAWPEAGFTALAQYVNPKLVGVGQAAGLPSPVFLTAHAVPGGFRGKAPGGGAVFVGDQFASGWRLQSGGSSIPPQRVFDWAMRFPVASGGAFVVRHPSQVPRRIEIALIALLWVAALWITRRPSRT
jgi:hypothetical protein